MHRKSVFLAVSLCAALSGASAFAQADFNGLYAGVVASNTDGAFDLKNAPLATAAGSSFFGTIGGTAANSSPKFSVDGWNYGVTGGYNHQSGPWLTGVEGDLSYSTAAGELRILDRPSAGTGRFNTLLGADVDYTATLRMRAGYVAGPVLLFGTAGAGATKVSFDRNYRNNTGATIVDSDTETVMALAYGGGAEWQMNNRWTVKADYLFMDGGENIFATEYSDGTTGKAAVDFDFDVYRIGINYRF
jgi:outer membrane immunogenic protein